MRVHHLNCGSLHPPTMSEIVCHVLLCETADGLVLVDSGLGRHDFADPKRMGVARFLMRPDRDDAKTADRPGRGAWLHGRRRAAHRPDPHGLRPHRWHRGLPRGDGPHDGRGVRLGGRQPRLHVAAALLAAAVGARSAHPDACRAGRAVEVRPSRHRGPAGHHVPADAGSHQGTRSGCRRDCGSWAADPCGRRGVRRQPLHADITVRHARSRRSACCAASKGSWPSIASGSNSNHAALVRRLNEEPDVTVFNAHDKRSSTI